ncbi:MAG: GntR family transcriptional regulator [Hyphomicrobiaceae bacterium]|nr:GntR family transcriptional regulator [Hyphomicrobiaceae bacterium]
MKMEFDELTRIKRVTMGSSVHAQLRDLIMAGKLAPGEKLSLRKLAALVGVSTMPVREAVIKLVAEQALILSPNRAVSVPLMTRSRFEELTIIRREIEGFAAAQAALKRSAKQMQTIRRLHDAFAEQVATEHDAQKALRLNMSLHFAIYAAAGLPMLKGIIEGLWLRGGPILNFDLGSSAEPPGSEEAVRCHIQMVDGIARRDPDAARTGLQNDISTASSFIFATGKILESLEEGDGPRS